MDLDEVGDVDLDVVVGLVATLPMTRTHSLPAEILIIRFLLREMLGSLLKGVVMVDYEVLTVVVVVIVEVSAMVKLVKLKKDNLREHLIVVMGLDVEMNSNVKVQDVVIGEPKLMNLLSKNSSQNLVANETEKNLGDEKPTIEEDIVDDFRSRKNHTLSAMLLKFSDYSQLRDKFCECYVCNILLVFNYIYYLIINYQVKCRLGEEQDESEEEAKRATVLFPNKK
ncbi:hypothetical protein glysoja_014823 [Glycine soja]|nr:hypothetical protein glysoja_014823 [Glycine soja]